MMDSLIKRRAPRMPIRNDGMPVPMVAVEALSRSLLSYYFADALGKPVISKLLDLDFSNNRYESYMSRNSTLGLLITGTDNGRSDIFIDALPDPISDFIDVLEKYKFNITQPMEYDLDLDGCPIKTVEVYAHYLSEQGTVESIIVSGPFNRALAWAVIKAAFGDSVPFL